MRFYARFQDEVVSEPALIAAHVERARGHVSPAFRTIFDEKLVAAHKRLVADPADAAAKVAFVTIYHSRSWPRSSSPLTPNRRGVGTPTNARTRRAGHRGAREADA